MTIDLFNFAGNWIVVFVVIVVVVVVTVVVAVVIVVVAVVINVVVVYPRNLCRGRWCRLIFGSIQSQD